VELVWRGLITNDSLHALRAYIAKPETGRTPRRVQQACLPFAPHHAPRHKAAGRCFAQVRAQEQAEGAPSTTEASHALALQLLTLWHPVARARRTENIPGGFPLVRSPQSLEESGRIRRGYFVAGLGATQFALPAAVDLLRQLRTPPPDEKPEFVQLADRSSQPLWVSVALADLPVAAEILIPRHAFLLAQPTLKYPAQRQLVAWLRRAILTFLSSFLRWSRPLASRFRLALFLALRGQDGCARRATQATTTACSSPPSTANLWPRTPWPAF